MKKNYELEKLEEICHTMSELDYDQLKTAFHHQATLQITRTWFKVGRMLMEYIVSSQEKPFGTIIRYFWHWEFQDSKRNLPHIHAIFFTVEQKSNPVDLKYLLSKIRCSLRTFLGDPNEVAQYVMEGLLPKNNVDTINEILGEANRILRNNCINANNRCHHQTGLGENDTECRVPDYFEISFSSGVCSCIQHIVLLL